MYYFEIVKNKKGMFELCLKAKNGDLIFQTEPLMDKATAKKFATKIRDLKPETEIRDMTEVAKPAKTAAKPAAKPVAKKMAAKETVVKSKTQELLES